MNNISKKIVVALSTLVLLATACSKKSTSSGGAASTPTETSTANIYGLVSSTAASYAPYSVEAESINKIGNSPAHKRYNKVTKFSAVPNCTVCAKDLMTGVQVGTCATSDAEGKYQILGLTAGDSYTIVADCGDSGKFSSVETSDTKAKTEKSPAAIDPLTSLIATKIIQAIYEAIDSAVGALPESFRASLKQTLIDTVVPSIVSAVKVAIEEAVSTGAMEAPTVAEATALSTAVSTTTETSTTALDTAATTYETTAGNEIPPAVTQTFAGASADAATLAACDAAYQGTEATCIKAITKLLFTGLKFEVLLRTTGGAFPTFTCTDTDTVLDAEFDNFKTEEVMTGLCLVAPKIQSPNRNARAEDGGGDKGGPMFSESFDFDGTGGDNIGYLTALGSAMFNKYTYNLTFLDKMFFGWDTATGSGMNGRLSQYRMRTDGPPQGYYLAGSTWTLIDHPALSQGPWPLFQCMSVSESTGDYTVSTGSFQYWTGPGSSTCVGGGAANNGQCVASCSTFDTIITGLGSSNFIDKGVFAKSFGGPIPTQAQLDDHFDNGRVHTNYNPSGEPYKWVLWGAWPEWEHRTCVLDDSAQTACQDYQEGQQVNSYTCTCQRHRYCDTWGGEFDLTKCTTKTGTQPIVRVDITFGTAVSSGKHIGFKPITAITQGTLGRYYLTPIWGGNSFSGLFNLIDSRTGSYVRDDYFNFRSIKVILRPDSVNSAAGGECHATAHGTATSCNQGDVYNVDMQWGEGGTLAYEFSSPEPITLTLDGGMPMQGEAQAIYNCQMNQPCMPKVGYSASGNYDSMQALAFDATINAGTTGLVSLTPTSGTAAYYLSPNHSCTQESGCTRSGYILVKDNGSFLGEAEGKTCTGSDCKTDWKCNNSGGDWSCTQVATFVIPDATVGSLLGSTNLVSSGTATWFGHVVSYQVPNAPAPNPVWRCSAEPFFIDGGTDGLTCNSTDTAVAGGDITFSSDWAAKDYQRNGHSTAVVQYNDNAYAFGDPMGAKTLMSTAFKGWLDGQHTLDATTSLNGLQTLALIYLWFEEGGDGEGKRVCTDTAAGTEECLDAANPNATYQHLSPMFEGGGNGGGNPAQQLIMMNKAFAAPLTTWRNQ
jgi:hypothetical protein